MSEVKLAPEITGIPTRYARRAIDALAEEVPDLKDYVIDVAIRAGREPLVAKLNPLLSSGLYASQPTRVTQAMARPGKAKRSADWTADRML